MNLRIQAKTDFLIALHEDHPCVKDVFKNK